jgi:hypothetical protein
MTSLEGFEYGLLGGAFAELLGLFKLRHHAADARPVWLTSPWYWIITGLLGVSI